MRMLKRMITALPLLLIITLTLSTISFAQQPPAIQDHGSAPVLPEALEGTVQDQVYAGAPNVAAAVYHPLAVPSMLSMEVDHLFDQSLLGYNKKLEMIRDEAYRSGNIDLAKQVDQRRDELIVEVLSLRTYPPAGLKNPDLLKMDHSMTEKNIQSATADRLQAMQAKYMQSIAEFQTLSPMYAERLTSESSAAAADGNVLPLNTPLDISFPEGYMAIFAFTTSQAGEYKFFTSPYGGTGGANDTVLYLFADAATTQQIAMNDDANGSSFSEIKLNLPANTTYYLILTGYSYGAVNARLTATFTPPPVDLVNYLDIDLPAGSNKIVKFTPAVYGTFSINTNYFGGNSANGPSDTYLSIYSDANLTNLIAFNDDSGGSTFSNVTLNMLPGRTYYIKLYGYGGGSVRARLSAQQLVTAFNVAVQGVPLSVIRPVAIPEFIQFTPPATGTYQIKTSPLGGAGPVNDTFLELYSSPALTNRTQFNDNANGSLFSQLVVPLTAGVPVYIILKEAQGAAVQADFGITAINPQPTVTGIEAPTIAAYSLNGSYEIFAYGVADQLSGVASVKFPTWTALAGQDDLVWHEGINMGNGTWKATIPFSQHKKEVGKYITHVYVYTNAGGNAMVGAVETKVTVSGDLQYKYNASGLLDYILLPNGQILDYQYDANGNLLRSLLTNP